MSRGSSSTLAMNYTVGLSAFFTALRSLRISISYSRIARAAFTASIHDSSTAAVHDTCVNRSSRGTKMPNQRRGSARRFDASVLPTRSSDRPSPASLPAAACLDRLPRWSNSSSGAGVAGGEGCCLGAASASLVLSLTGSSCSAVGAMMLTLTWLASRTSNPQRLDAFMRPSK